MRKLAAVSLGLSAAVFAANYILPFGILIPAALLVLAAALLSPSKTLKGRYAAFALFGAVFGLLLFAAHHQLCGLKAEALEGEEREIYCVVAEYPKVYDDYCSVIVKLKTPGLPSGKALLYVDGQHISDLQPGQRLRFFGKLKAADSRFGEDYDNYYTQGIYLSINGVKEIYVYSGGVSLAAVPVKLNRHIAQLVDEAFPNDVSAFMKALMLGDKTELYTRTEEYTALTNAGLMHIVAVSGMHIAFLVAVFRVLFGYGAGSSSIALLGMWLFVFVSGMSPSAVRAGIMQSFILFAPIVRRENDPLTSLSAALALILIMNPYAAKSVSLQLSFAATAGILFLSPLMTEALMEHFPEKYRSAVQTVCVSAAGMVLTMPLTAIHFGQVSLCSILSNVLVLPAVSLCFCGGYIACFAGAVFPAIGAALAWLDAWAARYIIMVARLVSRVPYATIFLDNPFLVLWLSLSYAVFIAFIMHGRNLRQRLVAPLLICAVSLLAVTSGLRLYYRSSAFVTALDVGQGQCICVLAGDKTLMIDCGSTKSAENAGKKAAQYLRSCGRDKVDVLLLTHLHEDHANGVTQLSENIEIDRIVYSPGSEGDTEFITAAEKRGVKMHHVETDSSFELGAVRVKLIPPESLAGDEACLAGLISIGDYDILITGDSDMAAEKRLAEKYELYGTELYIVGHHGSRYSSSEELIKALGGHTAIISVGYNTYGHPTDETLERLRACGYNIYRTDLNGNIEIRIG